MIAVRFDDSHPRQPIVFHPKGHDTIVGSVYRTAGTRWCDWRSGYVFAAATEAMAWHEYEDGTEG